MQFRLNTRPADAPGCIKLELEDSDKSVLIQTDWEWPGLASALGWGCQCHPTLGKPCACEKLPCSCGTSDGTVDCPTCKIRVVEDGKVKLLKCTASRMIMYAREWLDEHDGVLFDTDEFTEHYFSEILNTPEKPKRPAAPENASDYPLLVDVQGEPNHELDEHVGGVYEFRLPIGCPPEVGAYLALKLFHETVAIKDLSSFEITVKDEHGEEVLPDSPEWEAEFKGKL